MNPRLRNVVAAVGAAALVVVSSSSTGAVTTAPVSGGPAGQGVCATQAKAARPRVSVAALRAFADCEIGRRQKALAGLVSAVNGSKALTASDRAALAAELGAESSGLASLRAKIDGQTSIPALRLEVVQIASSYRLYLLVAPQVHLVDAADGVLALRPSLTQTATVLAARIATAQANGAAVATAQAGLDSMNSEISAAMALASPLPGRLLSLTAATWNAGAAAPVLKSARTALASARDHLRAAVKFGRAAIVALP
jgi:hypothetical protein